MPVLNAMPYLPEALSSIANQTFQGAEILAWDNGSTDGSVEVLHEWIPRRIPGRVITERPLPLGECRAQMVLDSQSEFIALHDADDRSHPDRLARQVAWLTSRKDLVAIGSQETAIDSQGNPVELPPQLRMETDFAGTLHTMMIGFPLLHPSGLYRRNSVIQAGNYRTVDSANHVGEDVDLMMRLAALGGLESLSDELYIYRFHGKSVSQNLVAADLGEARMNETFAANASALYGWTRVQALALRNLRVPFSFPLLWRAARMIAKKTGIPVRAQSRRTSWTRVVNRLTKRSDFLSRWIWKMVAV